MTVIHKAEEDYWNKGVYYPRCNQKGNVILSLDSKLVNCKKCLYWDSP